MKKQAALKIVNPLLLLSFVAVAGAAIGKRAGLVDGDLFRVVHPNAGLVFIGLALVHLALNWSWVKAAFLGKPSGGRRP